MVTVQVSMGLPQVVRLNKVAHNSTNLQNVMKTLSLKEAGALENAFQSSFNKIKEEKLIPWE
jgi:hypothetical protein